MVLISSIGGGGHRGDLPSGGDCGVDKGRRVKKKISGIFHLGG